MNRQISNLVRSLGLNQFVIPLVFETVVPLICFCLHHIVQSYSSWTSLDLLWPTLASVYFGPRIHELSPGSPYSAMDCCQPYASSELANAYCLQRHYSLSFRPYNNCSLSLSSSFSAASCSAAHPIYTSKSPTGQTAANSR